MPICVTSFALSCFGTCQLCHAHWDLCLALPAYCKEHKTGEGLGVRVVIAAGQPGVVSLGCPLDPPHLQVNTTPEGVHL